MVLSVLCHMGEQTYLFLSPQGKKSHAPANPSQSVLTGNGICNLKWLNGDAMKGLSTDAQAAQRLGKKPVLVHDHASSGQRSGSSEPQGSP